MSTRLIVLVAWLIAAIGVDGASSQSVEQNYPVPHFRHVSLNGKIPKLEHERVTFLADQDFPPFSYADASGNPKGIAVDEALSLCTKMNAACSIKLVAWSELAAA